MASKSEQSTMHDKEAHKYFRTITYNSSLNGNNSENMTILVLVYNM